MDHIKAIGFDLFNTLITVKPHSMEEAMDRLCTSLVRSGFTLQDEAFKQAHREAALVFLDECRRTGKETHNRFWISTALRSQGHDIQPDDPHIAIAVDEYFSAFVNNSRLIPGTRKMLQTLKKSYGLGLLSNFTHAPAARRIIDSVGLTPFFRVVLISGELGFRKPHPLVFQRLIERMGVKAGQILYIGDDPESDIMGAQQAGLQPVWPTYIRDRNIPAAPGIPYTNTDMPDCTVPRISVWNDLLSLLDK